MTLSFQRRLLSYKSQHKKHTRVPACDHVGCRGLRVALPPPRAGEQLAGGLILTQCRIGDEQIHGQAAPALNQRLAAITVFGWLAIAFPHDFRFEIGSALVGGVGALLTLEIHHAVVGLGRINAIPAHEALEERPSVDQKVPSTAK